MKTKEYIETNLKFPKNLICCIQAVLNRAAKEQETKFLNALNWECATTLRIRESQNLIKKSLKTMIPVSKSHVYSSVILRDSFRRKESKFSRESSMALLYKHAQKQHLPILPFIIFFIGNP